MRLKRWLRALGLGLVAYIGFAVVAGILFHTQRDWPGVVGFFLGIAVFVFELKHPPRPDSAHAGEDWT
jgi:hypothetical protein